MSLREYQKRRDFKKTKEPKGKKKNTSRSPIFVVQEHWASHHHFDFRLEAFGTLKSWAVPKGPSMRVGNKRLAVEVEDHPIEYAKFAGTIPKGEYGAGEVEIWDKGHWSPPTGLRSKLKEGHLEFELQGEKLKGRWLLQRTGKTSGRKSQWLLIKRHDVAQEKPAKKKSSRADKWPIIESPQLATLVDKPPESADWLHEIKLDGYRSLAHVRSGKTEIFTRNNLNWTSKYPSIVSDLKHLHCKSALLDGEIVVEDAEGHSSFSLLQEALREAAPDLLRFVVFDLLYLDGQDLREESLEVRKNLLKKLIGKSKLKRTIFSSHLRGRGEELFEEVCHKGLEGLVSKRRSGSYIEARSQDWLKIKCSTRQEFVIGGYTDPEGSRAKFGALLMGVAEDEGLRYVGRVGTGFTEETLQELYFKMSKLKSKKSPFVIAGPSPATNIHWLKPKLVAEIAFRTWTNDKILRQASFQGLREDKPARDVKVDVPKKLEKKKLKQDPKAFHITHPERVIYPKTKDTKLDIANYYRSVAPWFLKYSKLRPLSLVRCPDSAGENCFYQKHLDSDRMDKILEAEAKAKGEKSQIVNAVDSEEGLLQMVQWGVLEIHTWQAHFEDMAHPDQIVFDLDPDDGLEWGKVKEAALRLKDLLERLHLKSFLKTTGGKGLHLNVPIAPLYDWAKVKAFAKTVTMQLESDHRDEYTTNSLKKKREGKIFLDYLRNGFGATAIAPYSLRNKERPFVSVPLAWDELKTLKSSQAFEKDLVLKRLVSLKADPWPRYSSLRQKISILS